MKAATALTVALHVYLETNVLSVFDATWNWRQGNRWTQLRLYSLNGDDKCTLVDDIDSGGVDSGSRILAAGLLVSVGNGLLRPSGSRYLEDYGEGSRIDRRAVFLTGDENSTIPNYLLLLSAMHESKKP